MSADLPPNKKTKIKRALKSAARLPRVPALKGGRGRGSGRGNLSPRPGEPPVVLLRLQVLGCMGLLSKDKNGLSDPFVTVSVLNKREQTPVSKRTLNPTFAAKDATFDFPLYLSLADRLGVVELVVWDKDMLKKDYLGEVSVPLDDWFRGGDEYAFDSPGNKPFSLNLVSTRANTPSSGTIQVKLGFAPTPNSHNLMEYDEIYGELVKRSRPSLVSAPPTEGVGTIRSHPQAHYHDDGGLSSDSEDEESDADLGETSDTTPPSHSPSPSPKPLLDIFIPPTTEIDLSTPSLLSDSTPQPLQPVEPEKANVKASLGPVKPPFRVPPELNILPSSPATPTPGNLPTAVPRRFVSHPVGQGHAETAVSEETPKASAGFSLPAPQPSYPSSASSSRFIPNPKKFVRKISGLTSGGLNSPASPAVDAQGNLVSPVPGSPKPSGRSFSRERRKFGRSWSGNGTSSGGNGSGSVSPSGSGSDTGGALTPGGGSTAATTAENERRSRRMRRKKKEVGYEFKGANDIVGIVMLEIQGADDLPKISNMTRTGWDMDAFVVISFGKKVFRTRVIRHSLNPTWDEKLLFHVRRYETSYKIQLTVLDWDKLTSNDHVGEAALEVRELMEGGVQPDPETGLYKFDTAGDGGEELEIEKGMKEFKLRLETGKNVAWEARHSPTIRFRAKYQPYDALRQRFWRQYLRQYDVDNTNTISHLELTAMLDSLGSTLTRSTLATFFTRFGKNPKEDELSIDQAVMCLEAELGRPVEEKRRLDEEGKEAGAEDPMGVSVTATPVMMLAGERGEEVPLDWGKMDFSGPPHVGLPSSSTGGVTDGLDVRAFSTEPMQMPLQDAAAGAGNVGGDGLDTPYLSSDDNAESGNMSPTLLTAPVPASSSAFSSGSGGGTKKKNRRIPFRRSSKMTSTDSQPSTPTTENSPSPEALSTTPSSSVERVINVKNCPLCHRPRLNSKAEIDIVTHLAICASEDWNKVDKIMVGNFVTASQAQRKWYTKVIGRVGKGDYRLGANSANIIVQNRMTGQLEEEKMQVYVRLGIRLLYKGASSRMEGSRARRLLKSLSVKQGIKYDDPESAKDIPAFIQFHGLNVNEILEPIDSFRTFNEFFYRKLKPSARPVECPDDPYRLVSAADCRLLTFESVTEATRLWIKGREFTVARLLGDAYKNEAHRYAGGALAIFRLAPQDYHRFHSPADGKIGKMTYIAGEYYTVNPQAIRSTLDVYGENARKIVPIDSPQFGRVMAVCVGAMMVGSIKTTVEEGETVRRGQEIGYFAFGGSTIVILFEKGRVEWDEDLLINGRASLETLVRVGMGIGRGRPGVNTPTVVDA